MASVLPGLLLLTLVAPATAGTTWHVDAAAACPGAGSLAAPFCSIQAALDAATPGDEILVEAGLYNELLDFLGKDVELRSVAGAATTIVDGRNLGTIVTFDGGESRAAVLSGFTLRNGSQGGPGGSIFGSGIRCALSSPTIADNAIEACTGSGLALLGGSPLVTGNTIRDNSGGAGIFCGQGTSAQIIDNEVLSNAGSGIQVHDSGVLIEGNLVEGNISTSCCAGVIVTSDEEVVIRANVIRFNSALNDAIGGLRSDSNTLVEDNLIDGNRAYTAAGAVWANGGTYRNNRITGNFTSAGFTMVLQNGVSFEGDVFADNPGLLGLISANTSALEPVRLTRVTIARNGDLFPVLGNGVGPVILEDCLIADNPAGGVYTSGTGNITLRRCTLSGQVGPVVDAFEDGHVSLESCIVWGNGSELVASTGGSIDATWSIVEGGWPGTGNLDADPLFANPAGNDYALLPGSPAIDGGLPTDSVSGFDLAGTPRRLDGLLDVGSEVDRGALEFDNVTLATSSPAAGVLQIDLTGTAGLQTFILAAPATGALPVEKWGTIGLDLSGPWFSAPWPGAPSSIQVGVSPVFSGVPLVLQVLAGPPGQLGFTGNLSNAESIELP